jgi:alpha/beta superfamily hydrolase
MNVTLNGPVGELEAIHELAPNPSGWAAVVCHPHPVYGGTMHNRVVVRIARAFLANGAHVLRFNFRGVGTSQGGYDGGVGEQEDVAAAFQYLKKEHPGLPLALGGFSFGSWVGFRASRNEETVSALLGVGIPTRHFDFSFLNRSVLPKWIVQGADDEFGRPEDVREVVEALAEPKGLTVVPEADHFFSDHIDVLAAELDSAVKRLAAHARKG